MEPAGDCFCEKEALGWNHRVGHMPLCPPGQASVRVNRLAKAERSSGLACPR